jgi:pimeloyl-ACP methyl ester carboxylesterase
MPQTTVNGHTVHYTDTGAGEAVMLLHSGLYTSAQWRGILPYLADRFRVLAIDFYNMGGTQRWPGPGILTYDDDVLLLQGLVAQLGVPLHLVGHSYGGTIAVKVAVRHPPGLRSMAVIEPLVVELLESEGELVLYREYTGMVDGLLAAYQAGDRDAAWAGFFDYRNGAGAWRALSAEMRGKLDTYLEDLVDMCRAETVDRTLLPRLRRLRIPTLIAHGEHTTRPDIRAAELLHEAIPDSRYAMLRGGAHMAPVTHPEVVGPILREHLLRVTTAGA